GRPALQQPQPLGDGETVDHTGGAALLVASAARIEAAILNLALEGVPLPFVGVADAHGVDVAVVEQDARPVADAPQRVAHAVEADVAEAELAHFSLGALPHGADLRIHRR